MLRRSGRNAAVICALAASSLSVAISASATTVGSNLRAAPNGGTCAVPSGEPETSCTLVQALLADGHAAAGGVQTPARGVITRWRVSSGSATPGTASVKLRLRTLDAGVGLRAPGASEYVDLPLAQPGIHTFSTRMRIGPNELLGLDAVVTSSGSDEAAAPVAHLESGVGDGWKWVPSLGPDPIPTPVGGLPDSELLFNATIEPDRDGDGYGDRTQDRCPEDPTRQRNCDRRPPRTHLTYAPRQDFLQTGRLVVHLRSSEEGIAYASGGIEIPSIRTVWLTYTTHKRVERGEKARLVLRVPGNARRAVARAFAHGRKVLAKVTAYAVDAVGNQSGATVATIRPKR